MKTFLDTGSFDAMKWLGRSVDGFTTNPSLMENEVVQYGYSSWARRVLAIAEGKPVSFEVLADDVDAMRMQAHRIAAWGENVYVKIPITNTKGESMVPLVRELSLDGIKVNVTAVFTVEWAQQLTDEFYSGRRSAPLIISVFAGRIADTGVDPRETVAGVYAATRSLPDCEVLWASAREVLNVKQAEGAADIITLSPDLVRKLDLFGKDLGEYSLETVRQFHRDGQGLTFG